MIEVRLSHDFGAARLDLDLAAPKGVTALFGPSGAGKSSLAMAIAGLFRPDRGRIVLGGRVLQDGQHFVPPHRRGIGVVFQDHRLFPHLSVRQNLTYAQRHGRVEQGRADAARARGTSLDEVAGLLGLAGLLERGTGALSGGERARVAIGRALLSEPAMLILDEPFAALDAQRRAEILPFLQGLRDRFDLPILFISHALGEVAQLATSLVVLEAGRVVAQGDVTQLLSDAALVPILGASEAGALILGRVGTQDGDGLTRVETAGGPVFLPGVRALPGATIRLRVRAQDVMLATAPLEGISALNLLAAEVESLSPEGEAGMIVRLRLGEERLLARITRRSATALALRPGVSVQAILKTVALAG